MNGGEIDKVLSNNQNTKKKFLGVYAKDQLPKYAHRGYYVINLDTSDKPGSHWVALEINKKGAIFFDSYGLKPKDVYILRFLKGKKIKYNQKHVQHPLSTTCGQWCIYFIWRRSTNWTLQEMLRAFFPKRFLTNDHVLNIVLKSHFKIKNQVINKKFLREIIKRRK